MATRKTTTTTTTRTTTPKTTSAAKPTASPAPLDAVALAHEGHAEAVRTLKRRESTLAECVDYLEDLEDRRDSGDESVTSRQVEDARGEAKHWRVLVNAAEGAVVRAERALINTSTVLADAFAPFLSDVLGLSVDTDWQKRSELPSDLPAAVLVQQVREEANDRTGLLSGVLEFYYFRTRLHVYPDAQETTDALSALGISSRITDGVNENADGVFTHHYRVKVESVAPSVPVIVATAPTSEHSRKYVGYALSDAVESGYLLDRSSLDNRRPTLGSNGLFDSNLLRGVTVQTGTPKFSSDRTDSNGTRTVTIVVSAKCRFSGDVIPGLRDNFSGLTGKMVGQMVPEAGRVSDVRVLSTNAPERVSGLDAQVLVSYVSALPEGQTTPTVDAIEPVEPDDLEPGDENLSDYLPRQSKARDVDAHGDREGTHPGVAS